MLLQMYAIMQKKKKGGACVKKRRHWHLPRLFLVLTLIDFVSVDLPALLGVRLPYVRPSEKYSDENTTDVPQAAPSQVEEPSQSEQDPSAQVRHTVTPMALVSYTGTDPVVCMPGKEALQTDEVLSLLYEKMEIEACRVSNEKGENGYPAGSVRLTGEKVESGQIGLCLSQVSADHPEFFWLSRKYSYHYEGNDTVIQLYSYISGSECETLSHQLQQKINSLMDQIPPDSSELQREKYLYDWIANNCQYDQTGETAEENWRAYSLVGCLLDGEAVCEGYARTLQLLLNQTGILCRCITGTAGDGGHMWNMAKIEGEWVHVDLTWDDTSSPVLLYRYFNVSDEKITQTHTPSGDFTALSQEERRKNRALLNAPMPACTEESLTYYPNFALSFSEKEEENLTAAMVQAMATKERTVALYIPPELSYEHAVQRIFYDDGNIFTECVAQANRQGAGISYSDCVYYCMEEERGIVIVLQS